MQFCEPITATVIFPFVFQLVNETGVTKGNEDKTGYYAGIIVRSFLFAYLPSSLWPIWTGIDVLSCRDPVRPTVGETIGQDWSQTRRIDRVVGPHAFDALLWPFTDLPHPCCQPIPCRPTKWKRWRLEIDVERNHRRYQRRPGIRLPAYSLEHGVDSRVC